MQAACEAGEVWALLEAGAGAGAGSALLALYSSVREPWLTRGMLLYHARTGSPRVLDALARAPDHHARMLLDALGDELQGERAARHRALAALAPLVARRPLWLHRLQHHPALRAVMRAARAEREPTPRLHALLALAALAQHAPQAASLLLPDLAEALLRAAAATEPHLQLAAHALFHALYAEQPAALLDALRAEYLARDAATRERLQRVLPALLEAQRLHPLLVLGGRAPEGGPWETSYEHDEPLTPAPLPPPSPVLPGAAALASRAVAALRPPTEPWFPLGERCGADSAPHTPLPPEGSGEGGSPPEAAVEATPENTPAKEPRAHFTFSAESSTVRAIGRLSQPPSPLRKESSPGVGGGAEGGHPGRLARVVLDRAQAEAASPGPGGAARGGRRGAGPDSPVPFGGAPPAAVARPEPRPPEPEPEPLNVEDREVLELTSRAEEPWGGARGAEGEGLPRTALLASLRALAPRAARPVPRPTAPAPRRAASCPPMPHTSTHEVAVQTIDTTPEPYEFIFADFFKAASDDAQINKRECASVFEGSTEVVKPGARLDAYLARLYEGGAASPPAPSDLAAQLALTHAALQFERWRREAMAERCRRLLGRCRQARAHELSNAALRDRARALQRDLDECRARQERAAAPTLPDLELEHVARLEAQLVAERAARHRAEAHLKEAESQRLADSAELQRLRGAQWEAARRVEQLARAAVTAERRAEQVRRMRQELLLLGEREHALQAHVARADMPAEPPGLRAAREEAAAARHEADVATQRADQHAARAHDLEAQLAGKEGVLAELRRAHRLAAEEHAARLGALQDKYRALLNVQRRMETRRLEWLAGGGAGTGGAGGGAVSPHSSPLSASLASGEGVLAARPQLADCSRVRHLLEDDDPAPAPPMPR